MSRFIASISLKWGKKGGDLRRDEPLLCGNEFGDQGYEGGRREAGESNTRAGAVEAGHVLVRAEEADLALVVLVGFHAFEAFGGIVEDAGGRVEGEVLVGGYSGRKPALEGGPFGGEHVVCEVKEKRVVSCLLLSEWFWMKKTCL